MASTALDRASSGSETEKSPPQHIDRKQQPFIINGEVIADPDEGLSAAERAKHDRALLWKLDLKLIPWLCLLYLASFLDRAYLDGWS